jgi:exodeoxyribonuclease V alpha subunit
MNGTDERFDFRPRDLPGGVETLRAFDRLLARWVLAQGGSPMLAQFAAFAAAAEAQGHACLAPGQPGPPALDAESRSALLAEPLVGDGSIISAFVLDAADRFYLWRNYRHEQVAARAIEARRALAAPPPAGALDADLDVLFDGASATPDPLQRAAVAGVAGRRWFVLTGGPGTGKTSTVLRMLLLLARRAAPHAPLIGVAAPTGKAAQRIAASLREGKTRLAASLPPEWQALLPLVRDDAAMTVHRLLGWNPALDRWRHDARHPLPHDVIVVDEASMLDLSMLRALLDAVRPDATLVLVGDAGQLSSVGAGSVLADVVAGLAADARGDLVRLQRVFRAEHALVAVNEAAGAGDEVALRAAFGAAGDDAVLHEGVRAGTVRGLLHGWADRLAQTLPRRASDAGEAAAALAVLGECQLLCALREGPFGAAQASEIIEQRLRLAFGAGARGPGFAGRAVLVTRNDPARRLYNGDVGLELEAPDGRIWVWFPMLADDGSASARALPPAALPPHESAFALTVHKSQGSEYGEVALLLPPEADNPILTRSLLYTGLSRARRRVELWAAPLALTACLARGQQREGGLRDRLVERR